MNHEITGLNVLTSDDDISRNPDLPQAEDDTERDQALIARIRSRFKEIETIIEGMKSKLPDKD